MNLIAELFKFTPLPLELCHIIKSFLLENKRTVNDQPVDVTEYTLSLSDVNSWIGFSATTPVTVTIPNNASFPLGTEIDIFQDGPGQVGFTSTVTILSPFGNRLIATQHSGATLKLVCISGENITWELMGNLTS
jgi:hypothetical protein